MTNSNEAFEKEFDEMIATHANNLDIGKKIFIESFLREIVIHGYETLSDINVALNNHLDELKEQEKKGE